MKEREQKNKRYFVSFLAFIILSLSAGLFSEAAVFQSINVDYFEESDLTINTISGPNEIGSDYYGIVERGYPKKSYLYKSTSRSGKRKRIGYAREAVTDGKTIFYQQTGSDYATTYIYRYSIQTRKRRKLATVKNMRLAGCFNGKLYFQYIKRSKKAKLYSMDLKHPTRKMKLAANLPFESQSNFKMYGRYAIGVRRREAFMRKNYLYLYDISSRKSKKLSKTACPVYFQHKGNLYFVEWVKQGAPTNIFKLKKYNFRTKKTSTLVSRFYAGGYGLPFGAKKEGIYWGNQIIYRW